MSGFLTWGRQKNILVRTGTLKGSKTSGKIEHKRF